MTVEHFVVNDLSGDVSWSSDGSDVVKHYVHPAQAVPLRSGQGVLIVEPDNHPNNAVLYDADGSQKRVIGNPMAAKGALCFTACGYERDELTLIIRLPGLEFAYVIDEAGNSVRLQEIR
jgi:hypothetical protein